MGLLDTFIDIHRYSLIFIASYGIQFNRMLFHFFLFIVMKAQSDFVGLKGFCFVMNGKLFSMHCYGFDELIFLCTRILSWYTIVLVAQLHDIIFTFILTITIA